MRSLHIVAGLIGLASGAVALYALKGAELHRKSGMIFVYAMLFMSSSGAVMAALKPQRHLWRMCFALFIASISFFMGRTPGSPAQVFPEPLRYGAVLAIPVLLVLLLMFYWLARVLFTPRHRRA